MAMSLMAYLSPSTNVGMWLAQAATEPAKPMFDWVGPIAGTGMVGIFLLLVILRIKIMPTYVYDEAKKEWERERAENKAALDEARKALVDGNKVYTEQVIPTLTRALDAERELLDLRRQEAQRRDWGQGGRGGPDAH